MKFAVVAAAILSSFSHAGCFVTTSHGSAGRAPDSLIPKRSRLKDRIDPRSANALRKVLRAMMQHAIDIGLRADDPTREGS